MSRKSLSSSSISPKIDPRRSLAPNRIKTEDTVTPRDLAPAVIARAREMGLMTTSTQQIGARLPLRLLEQAKKRTGITSTTELLAFALANIAAEDKFAEAFTAARGKLDPPDIDVGF